MEIVKFRGSELPNPWTDLQWIWRGWLCRRSPACQNF